MNKKNQDKSHLHGQQFNNTVIKCTIEFEDQCSYEQQSKGFQSWSSACLSTSLAASLTLECPSLLVCSSCHCSGDWKFPQDLTWGQLQRKGIFTWLWEHRQCSLVLVPQHAVPDSYWQGWAADPTLFLQALSPSSEFSCNKINFNQGITFHLLHMFPIPRLSHQLSCSWREVSFPCKVLI